MQNKYTPYTVLGAVCMLAFLMSAFTVDQGEKAMVSRLGNLIVNSKTQQAYEYNPGLHFKIPFLDSVIILDTRLQSFDIPSSRVLTEEQKSVDVDYFVKWRIADLSLYYTRTAGNPLIARGLLIRKVNDLLRATFGDKLLVEVISDNRQDLMKHITEGTNTSAKDIGVEVVDVRIKSIDYPKEVTSSVYQRMKTQREQVAKMYRANGNMRAKEITSEADREGNIIQANAALSAAEIHAKGDGEAADIANKAYGTNPKFYKFWRMIRMLESTLANHSYFVLDTQNAALNQLLDDTQTVSNK